MPAMNEISLMFSGGVDSTVAALHLAKTYDRVHLLTYSNGHGHYGFGRAERRADELIARAPGRFVYHFESVRELFRTLTVSSLAEDYARYQSAFIWCMGCKLAMHTASVRYDRAHGISRHTDGSSADTSEMVEQMLISLSLVSHFYQDHGVAFVPTDYDLPRDAKRELLKASGLRMGVPLRDRYLGIQPSCIPGELYYLPYLLLKRPPRHPERMVASYILSRRPVMDRLVRGGGA
jgi:asparagine synthetase B (glutamine-hydrolysing)